MSKPLVFILNGSGGCGKDTFGLFCAKYSKYGIRHCSTVDPIKQAALRMGWDGNKDEKGRKFLSDLKDLCTEAFDTSFNYIKEQIEDADFNDIEYLFVDCREPKEIDKLVSHFGAKTIYIDASKRVPQINSNHADANVSNYVYDYYINNNGTIEDLQELAKGFMHMWDKEIEYGTFD